MSYIIIWKRNEYRIKESKLRKGIKLNKENIK